MRNYADKFDRPASIAAPTRDVIEDLVGQRVTSVTPLGGGFRHLNLRLRIEDSFAVLRLGMRRPEVELGVMAAVASDVPVASVHARGHSETWGPWALLAWVEGRMLVDLFEDPAAHASWSRAAEACGEVLAAIHAIALPQAGFFVDGDLRVEEPLGPMGLACRAFVDECLGQPLLRQRLGSELSASLGALLDHRWWELEERVCMTHSDFNSKNIMMRAETCAVGAVLDWEFAHAGAPLGDLGNFLRFDHEMPPAVTSSFETGYREAGGQLPLHWRQRARLLDVAAMSEMLTRADAGPRTIKTARGVIASTLEIFARLS